MEVRILDILLVSIDTEGMLVKCFYKEWKKTILDIFLVSIDRKEVLNGLYKEWR